MSIITKSYKFTYYNFDKNSCDARIIYETCRISLVSSFQCYWIANAPDLKNSQFPTGQTGVSISRSFLREKPWSFRHP